MTGMRNLIGASSSPPGMGCISEVIFSHSIMPEQSCLVGESVSGSNTVKPYFHTRNVFLGLGLLFAFILWRLCTSQAEEKDNKRISHLINNSKFLEILLNYKSKKINLKKTKTLLSENCLSSDQSIDEILINL